MYAETIFAADEARKAVGESSTGQSYVPNKPPKRDGYWEAKYEEAAEARFPFMPKSVACANLVRKTVEANCERVVQAQILAGGDTTMRIERELVKNALQPKKVQQIIVKQLLGVVTEGTYEKWAKEL